MKYGGEVMSQIELCGICKTFKISQRPQGKFSILRGAFARETKTVNALKDISFKINEGELIGYIGPNGAGKSTSVKIMSGILTPEHGSCQILCRTPWKERKAHVSQIGVVFGQRSQLWWDVPVQDSFELLKDIYSISPNDYAKRFNTLIETLDLSSFLKTPVRQLSLGQRMRCEIAAALIHNPKILFLDEPTIGLDAVSKLSLREFLKNENQKNGVTMILTTHDMDDIESLCKRVMVIGHGSLLYDGQLSGLKERYSPLKIIKASLTHAIKDISIIGSEAVMLEGTVCTIIFNPKKIPAYKLVEQLAKELPLKDISIGEENIDEIIATMYKELCL